MLNWDIDHVALKFIILSHTILYRAILMDNNVIQTFPIIDLSNNSPVLLLMPHETYCKHVWLVKEGQIASNKAFNTSLCTWNSTHQQQAKKEYTNSYIWYNKSLQRRNILQHSLKEVTIYQYMVVSYAYSIVVYSYILTWTEPIEFET